MIFAIGEILVDIFPEYHRIGGAPFNFAYHLKRFGFPVRFFSRIGKDAAGSEIRALMHTTGLDPSDLQIDADRETGRVEILFTEPGKPKFTIIDNAAYDAFDFDDAMERSLFLPPKIIYFGSLIQRTRKGFETLQRILSQKHPDTRCFYDVNLRPGCAHPHIVVASLAHADILKLNDDELEITAEYLGIRSITELESVKTLMARFNLSVVAVTHGADGSSLYTKEGRYETAAPVPGAVIDTVGAGDAFSAVLAAGLLSGWAPERILMQASRFAAHICTVKGAIPASRTVYEQFRLRFEEKVN